MSRFTRSLFGGLGAILLFHEIHKDADTELQSGASAAYLERLLTWMKSQDWEFVTLDEALRRLNAPRPARRFATVTFDDGYRDNLTQALPIVERLGIPISLFVPTHTVSGELDVWWLGLRALFRDHASVDIPAFGERLVCHDLKAKVLGLRRVTTWAIEQPERISVVRDLLVKHGVDTDKLRTEYFMTAAELSAFARHPLVTIGAHTTTHRPMLLLDQDEAHRDMLDNKHFLEAHFDQPVEHLAFPYGIPSTCGPRDFALAKACGFRSAYTTSSRVIRADDREDTWGLPRFDCGRDAPLFQVDYRISGLEKRWARS